MFPIHIVSEKMKFRSVQLGRNDMSFNCAHLFSLRPARGHVTMWDVRDAYELGRTIPRERQREAFYASQGLDMNQVERLYPTIVMLEDIYDLSPDEQVTKKNDVKRFTFGQWEIKIRRKFE